MIIAGLTGGIGHGKTTFANCLAAQAKTTRHFESWEIIAEVATGLREASPRHPAPDDVEAINEWLLPLVDSVSTCTHTVTSFEDLKLTPERVAAHPENYQKLFEYLRTIKNDPVLAGTEINADTKEQFRGLLQWLGGYLVAVIGNGVWYDEIVRRITYLQNQGYELVTVGGVRYPGDAERLRNAGGSILEINRPSLPMKDAADITERQRALIKPDTIITNDGTLEQLAELAAVVYRDLRIHDLKAAYQATAIVAA